MNTVYHLELHADMNSELDHLLGKEEYKFEPDSGWTHCSHDLGTLIDFCRRILHKSDCGCPIAKRIKFSKYIQEDDDSLIALDEWEIFSQEILDDLNKIIAERSITSEIKAYEFNYENYSRLYDFIYNNVKHLENTSWRMLYVTKSEFVRDSNGKIFESVQEKIKFE